MELGANWIGTPEYASPEALENVFNARFKMFHVPRATDDLFALGLVMFFIGSGICSQELVQYYAIMSTAVCTKESFPVLRRSRTLYARFMRAYYMSGFFRENLKTYHCQLGIDKLFFWMHKLVQLMPTTRLPLEKLLESNLFQAAVKMSAERDARDMHNREQLRIERRHAKDLENQKRLAETNASSLEKQLEKLRVEHQQAVAERDKLQAIAKQRDRRQNPLRMQSKELERQLEELRSSHQN